MYCVGHLSDLHVTPLGGFGPSLLNKRFWGWLSWQVRRRKVHRPEVLAALVDDLRETAPDHLVVTGDLTNVALEQEFAAARRWLDRLGPARDVTIVPGNHDAYVSVPRAAGWDHWAEFLASDEGAGAGGEAFPSVRVRGPVAVVGVCSALPTAPFQATGTVGPAQLERLEKRLAALSDAPLCRIVLVHHPITAGAVSPRRALTDAPALRAVLARTGAELVLHGHGHRTLVGAVEGPAGRIPVVGVRSSTDAGAHEHKRAQYHVYAIERAPEGAGARFRITLHTRGYDPATGRFRPEGSRVL